MVSTHGFDRVIDIIENDIIISIIIAIFFVTSDHVFADLRRIKVGGINMPLFMLSPRVKSYFYSEIVDLPFSIPR